ncbi:hypothetical protein GCM10010172_00630 [Paractinoplanes ferrugineus]|uniref:Uncharacterized protein n=1 Tax=Paractinoplanes ferrugineus TaxID=113564 RepID=A0A919J4T7_9ACTN|nr:DUF6232 family protein [Actinoplanes ferrugineus]GIE13910.1 hypothetical protein Afe05nite_57500 [Actinoplanes ferrugineus]
MRVFYRGHEAIITEHQFLWLTGTLRSFDIVQLRRVRVIRRNVKIAGPRTGVVASAVMAAAGIGVSALFVDALAVRLALAGVAVLLLASATFRRRAVPCWEIRAMLHGRETTIYSTRDITTFNQVKRGLSRALENAATVRGRPRAAAA